MYSALLETAKKVRENAYAPYSNFTVGAALLTKDNRVFTGCNIENAAFSPTNCAERTAFFKAISEGERDFEAIAIVGGKKDEKLVFCPPCGVCRQVMLEFCSSDFMIVLEDENEIKTFTLSEMIPFNFNKNFI